MRAWLDDEPFFPHSIPFNRSLDADDHAGANSALQQMRDASKERRGCAYSIEWIERRSTAFGRNLFPQEIYFESQDDLLSFIDKQDEFAAFSAAVMRLRSEFPSLDGWILSHRQLLIEIEPSLNGLLEVLRYFQSNPRPNRFARELPLSVDTKFIERHVLSARSVPPPVTTSRNLLLHTCSQSLIEEGQPRSGEIEFKMPSTSFSWSQVLLFVL